MARIELRGMSVAYDDVNRANAEVADGVILLVHGHPFDRSMWRPNVDALASAGWRVIAPDLRGYGETTVVSGTTPLDVFADDLAALLDALGVGVAVVGGLSMGGHIAMEFARRHSDRLQGLVLAATFPRPETDESKRDRMQMADRLDREGMAAYTAEVLPKMFSAASIANLPHVVEHVRFMMQNTPPRGAAAAQRGRAERPSYEPVLESLTVPVLIISGDEDVFTTSEDLDAMQGLLAHGRLVLMAGVGHLPNLERPQEFNEAVTAFLRGCATRRIIRREMRC